MNNRIFYHKRTGEPVQIIVHAQTKPNFQEVICYQELTKPFACYVMEKRQFFAEYVKEFTKLPLTGKVPIEKREDLPTNSRAFQKARLWRKKKQRKKKQRKNHTMPILRWQSYWRFWMPEHTGRK